MKNTLIFVGTGAVEHSWDPVVRALSRCYQNVPGCDPNVAFSRLIFDLRWSAQALSKAPRDGLGNAEIASFLREQRRNYDALKRDIARELILARTAGEIKLRPQAHRIIPTFCAGDEVQVVTTNWDLCVTDAFDPPKVAGLKFIHGSVNHPATMYLPTEMLNEPFRAEDDIPFNTMTKGAVLTMELVKKADRVVVYGLSISPLDAELGILLDQGTRLRKRKFERVDILDPNPLPVEERLRFFLGDQPFEHLDMSVLT